MNKSQNEYAVPLFLCGLYIFCTTFVHVIIPFPFSSLKLFAFASFFDFLKALSIDFLLITAFVICYYKEAIARKNELQAIQNKYIQAFAIVLFTGMSILILHEYTINKLYAAVYYLLIVAAGEEFVFRGYLFHRLNKNMSFGKAALISGILFGAAHGFFEYFVFKKPWYSIPSSLGGGVVGSFFFCFLFKSSKTILVPVGIHWVLDFLGYLF